MEYSDKFDQRSREMPQEKNSSTMPSDIRKVPGIFSCKIINIRGLAGEKKAQGKKSANREIAELELYIHKWFHEFAATPPNPPKRKNAKP
jgi:hypothetical protein